MDVEHAQPSTMSVPIAIAVTLLTACSPSAPPLDAPAAIDARLDAAGCTGTAHWLDRGVCFEAPRCCTSADCTAGWGCTAEGRCVDPARVCSCLTDADCGFPPRPTVCVTNDAVCGACVVLPDACPGGDGDCAASEACIAGACLDRASPCVAAP